VGLLAQRIMNIRKEVRDTFKYILIGLILAAGLNYGLGYVLGAREPVMAVVSGSMEPTLNIGELVVIRKINPDLIKVGDIVVYHDPYNNLRVVHRVVEIEHIGGKRYFITKGDNNLTNPLPDQDVGIAPLLVGKDIRGKVILKIPKLGLVKVYFSDIVAKYGIVNSAIFLLLVFIAFGILEDFLKGKKVKTPPNK